VEYNARALEQSAFQIAAHGIQIVRLYGVNDDYSCACGRPDCRTPGKHPSGGEGWQNRATADEDQIAEWFATGERMNIGIKLGRDSGIVDVEVDGPEAQETLTRFGLDQIPTPTYRARRGEHRLFRYHARLPDTAVVKVDDLEVRIGGGGKASQSVAPVSWHGSGIQYQWLEGLSIDDCQPAELPHEFLEAILNNSRVRGNGVVARAGQAIINRERKTAGARHDYLLGVASRFAGRLVNFTDAERQELHEVVSALNQVYCDPPKEAEELRRLVNDQCDYYQRQMAQRRDERERPLENCGLLWNQLIEEWEPGSWSLSVIHGDPVQYRLHIPSVAIPGKVHTITLVGKEFDRSEDVAVAIREGTQEFEVRSPNGTRWNGIWNGERIRVGEGWRDRTALRVKLWNTRRPEEADADEIKFVQHMNILLAYLYQLSRMEGEDESSQKPLASGDPKWIKIDGKWLLYFQWEKLLAAAWSDRRISGLTDKEKSRLNRELKLAQGREEWPSATVRFVGDKSRKYFVWCDDDINAIAKAVEA
jgi:hypothetical protein